jgi:uncharacterized membrane protein YfcA
MKAEVARTLKAFAIELAVGTDLFEIIVSASYGTLTHAVKGNVDILIALVMIPARPLAHRSALSAHNISADRKFDSPLFRFH